MPYPTSRKTKARPRTRGFELAFDGVEVRPEQRGHAFAAERFLRGEVEQDGSEERLGDADAAEDEVFPGGFEAGAGAVERDQQDGGERGGFHGDPEQAHVVGEQREEHGEHEELVHGVVEAQAARREAAVGCSRCACRGGRRARW